MGRKKGSAKTGGRLKGTPNRGSLHLEAAFQAEGIDIATEIAKIYKGLTSTEDRLKVLFRVMDYVYPRRKPIQDISEEAPQQTVVFEYVEYPGYDELDEEMRQSLQST